LPSAGPVYLQLTRLPEIGEAHAIANEQCSYRSEHRVIPGERSRVRAFASSLPLQRRRSRRRNHSAVPAEENHSAGLPDLQTGKKL